MYLVTADIEHIDGALRDLLLPAGFAVKYPTRHEATRVAQWIERVRKDNDFVRATGTGNRYVFRSTARIEAL